MRAPKTALMRFGQTHAQNRPGKAGVGLNPTLDESFYLLSFSFEDSEVNQKSHASLYGFCSSEREGKENGIICVNWKAAGKITPVPKTGDHL